MKIGTVTVGPTEWELTGTSLGSFASGLDGSISATLPTGESFAHVGPLFAAGSVEAMKLDGQAPADLPSTINFRPEPGLAVAALCLRDASTIRLYLPSKPDASSGRWVDVPRTPEFLAMAASDRDAQRKAWIAALTKVKPASWSNGIDLSKKNLSTVSAPALRILLAYVAAHACAVTGVNQPGDGYRGGQTHGLTLPLLRYPVSEPDCYIRVISGREGLLESINAYDLGAGISLGSIQFNVHRAAIFQFLHAFNEMDPDLFHPCFDRFGWSPKQVTIGGTNFFALDVVDAAGNATQLIGRDADHSRNCGYFQSGIPGHDSFNQIDAAFRKDLAAAFRDGVIWPHVHETIMGVSGEWLRPGLKSIEAAGILPVDTMRPDRDTFVLKALLLSAYVRYSACLAPLLKALKPYASVKVAIAAAQGAAAATDKAVLVEAIHQFQGKTYVDAAQHDGRCGESTLDNLGLYLGRPGLNQVDVANPTAQAHLTSINKKLAGVADNPAAPATLNAANWFRHMTAPSFLGQTFRNGIHAVLLRRLRAAERHLLGMPAYLGFTPVKLGQALGIQEFHRGSRPTATTASMHTFGLATDINYTGNPWIKGSEIVRVLQRARRLVSGMTLEGGSTAASLLHANANKTTVEIYDFLWSLDRDFRSYLALRDDAEELRQLLERHRQNGTPGIFSAGETLDQAAIRWRNTIASDLANLGTDDGFFERDPRNGFLNLSKDLVIALRDFGCLAWGASDFGPGESGDIMHFDCRNTGLGRVINKGFVPPERHCA